MSQRQRENALRLLCACRQGSLRGAQVALVLLFCAGAVVNAYAQTSAPSPAPVVPPDSAAPQLSAAASRPRYRLHLKLDLDARAYEGTQRVRWTNRDDRPASVVYFHLYPNLRAEGARPAAGAADGSADEPRLEVTAVRSARWGQPLVYVLEDQETTLRAQLREPVAPGAATEIEIEFRGSVPEIDPEETGLLAHVMQQVDAVFRQTRDTRRAREINFRSRGVMLLGAGYPALVMREDGEWQRRVEPGVGDYLSMEAADYEVVIEAPADVALFASGEERGTRTGGARVFGGEALRNFAILAGRGLQAEERTVGNVRVRSIFMPERAAIGRRALAIAAAATGVYTERFGPLPYKIVSIAEVPLVSSLGSADFAGLGVIASAYYADFDSPAMRNLPELVREQRASVEDSLEFAIAHTVAQQWWGGVVGSDPQRAPVLDEALANWSALLYYRDAHGPERAALALNDQLRGVYELYRTFSGEDMPADRPAREYRTSFQYVAIVACKGALMFSALRRELGDARFFTALRRYYEANRFEVAGLEDLRAAFTAEAPIAQRRALTRTFNRWLSERRGDEDVAPPNPELATALGFNLDEAGASAPKDRNTFARLGRFFWRQMTRIR